MYREKLDGLLINKSLSNLPERGRFKKNAYFQSLFQGFDFFPFGGW
jgi:hypothetical protein